MNKFATVEFDFRSQRLNLYKYDRNPPLPTTPATSSPIRVVSRGLMKRTRLGVWTADVHLDTYNGPVSMLVDTGAMSTLLNWKGIAGMNLSRDDGTVNRNRSPMGAIGADNIALALTHRITLRDQFTVGGSNVIGNIGVDLRKGGPINIDIGTIPVLDILSSDCVGGILGSDFITRCSVIRLNFDESNPKIIMYN